MEIITIANVSGFIAVAIVVVQFLIPNLLVIILSNSLGSSNSAVTWSVAGRALQSSNWPTLLRTEASSGKGAKGSVRAIAWAKALGVLLISVAGIVTPLGLYEDVVATGNQNALFNYAVDNGPFGLARLPRSSLGFNRMCGIFLPVLCPGVDDPYKRTDWPNGTITVSMDDGWDGRIPQDRFDYFESGLSRNSSTISSFWDIEWRSYNFGKDDSKDLQYMNGSQFVFGTFQNFDSLVVSGGIHLVDGLVVNSGTGAIGFRNHTVPTNLNNAIATWQEDLLFVEPETACVPNNLTLQFTVGSYHSPHNFSEVHLIDNGGFADIDLHIKFRINGTDAQNNLNLMNRAYLAAIMNNRLVGAYYNVTDINGTYMVSARGDSYEVGFEDDTPIYWDRMHTSQTFSDFLELAQTEVALSGNLSSPLTSQQPNPWNITQEDLNEIFEWCGWFDDVNPGNISTVAVGCNMAYSVARPVNGSSQGNSGPFGIVRQPGSQWSVDLYSCATAVKADIKTVGFSLNGTALEDVAVTSIADKVYASPADVPWWGVEGTHMKLSDGFPVWGLVDPNLPQLPNTTTVQKEALYLPGLVTNLSAGSFGAENLPATDFSSPILAALGFVGTDDSVVSSEFTTIDYSGVQSVAMLQKWSNLTGTAEGIAQIHQMIWGDIAANALVGTKGMAGRSPERQVRLDKRGDTDAPPHLPNTQPISLSTRRVLYRWPFAIPAFLVAIMALVVVILALISCCMHRSLTRPLRTALERTSAGRILAAAVYPHIVPPDASTKEWISQVGLKEVSFHRGLPTAPREEQEVQVNYSPYLPSEREKQPLTSWRAVSGGG